MRASTLLLLIFTATGCKKAPPHANPEFSDAVRFLFSDFEGEEADLAYALRVLEEQIAETMDLTAKKAKDRALQPDRLTREDVAHVDHPGRDLSKAIPVAVAHLSPFPLEEHPRIQLLADQRPVEPYSPEKYVRTFQEGRDCWADGDCTYLRTDNDLTKENFLMTVDYRFTKDFRWIDLNLPDPAEVPEGEEPENTGTPRWAHIARSWTDQSYAGRKGNSWIHQSFTTEVWIPDGDHTVRLLCLWSETEFDGLSVSDEQVIATTQTGIDKNMVAHDAWLEANR